MPGPELELRLVDVDSLDEIVAILNSAASWLSAKGVEQWPDEFTASQVRPTVLQGHTWLALADGQSVGTITLDWSDTLWHSRHEEAGYVHRLAVRRTAPGAGMRLLEWAAEAVAQRGRSLLRLDCVATNRRLRTYYEAAGFTHCGDVAVPYDATRLHSRYERELCG